MKTCSKCGIDRLISEYTVDTYKLSGLRPICKICDKEYRKGRLSTVMQNRDDMREYLAVYKIEAGCADCGYNAYACALDFDQGGEVLCA